MLAAATANSTAGGEITLVDADSGETIGHVSRAAEITQIADTLNYNGSNFAILGTKKFSYVNMLDFVFAGWFSSAEPLTASSAVSDKVTSLADAPSTIFAHWIRYAYLDVTIAYYSNDTRAPRIFGIFTTPDDIFGTYGCLYYYGSETPTEEQFVIDGEKIHNQPITLLRSRIAEPPFSTSDPKTANDFNGNLGGAYDNGTNGRLCYAGIGNITVGTTVQFRSYYITMDGTTVYGDIRSKTLLANTTDTGLEESTTNPVTPPTVDI